MTRSRNRTLAALAVGALSAGMVLAGCSGNTPTATPVMSGLTSPNPGSGDGRWIVAMGDSYISGEAGRMVNNGLKRPGQRSADPGYTVGSANVAYGQNLGKEEIPGCHRSHSAMIHIENGWNSENLACSGAQTNSFVEPNGDWKPGLDNGLDGRQSQTQMLQEFAQQKDVGAIVVSIGGNDMGFSSIVAACVEGFVLATGQPCADNPTVTKLLSPSHEQEVADHIQQGFTNIQNAMFAAGYQDKQWQLVYALPPMPLSTAKQMKYPPSQRVDMACPFTDTDLDWSNETLLPQLDAVMLKGFNQFLQQNKQGQYTVSVLNDFNAFDGHRLCEKSTDRAAMVTKGSSQDPDFATTGSQAEWINALRLAQQATPAKGQEAVHPNHWGQRALASCVRLTVSNPAEYADDELYCVQDGAGLNQWGDPNMTIDKTQPIPK